MIAGAREMSMICGNRLFIVDARASADSFRRSLGCEKCGLSFPLVTLVEVWHPSVMEHLGPHRTILDPHDTRGIGGVVKSTPIPRRGKPLEGTKDMLCPKDPVFLERITARAMLDEAPPPRSAVVMGVLAILCAAMLLLFPWLAGLIGWLLHEAGKRWAKTFPDLADSVVGLLDSMGFFIVLLSLAGVHLFGVFSHILSKGRVSMGAWAILGVYVGMFVNLVLLHWFG